MSGTWYDHAFVRALSDGQLDALRSCARPVSFAAQSFIFREGGAADTLYLVVSGCVALEAHVPGRGVVPLESLCSGDILGLSWLFSGGTWMLDARCLERVEAIAIDAACLRARMQQDAALGQAVLARVVDALYQRLVRVRLQRLDVYKTEARS